MGRIKLIWLWLAAASIRMLVFIAEASAKMANVLMNHYLDAYPLPGTTVQESANSVFLVNDKITLTAPKVGQILFRRL
jgi:hypothetical protein